MSGPTNPDDVMAQAWRDNAAAEGKPAAPATQAPDTNPAGDPATDYADAWTSHASPLDNASSNWNDLKKQHPVAALALSVLPGTAQITSAAELNDAANRHDPAGMVKAASGMVPGVALLAIGTKAVRAGKAAADATKVASGAATAATGAGALATGAAAKLDDYAQAWHTHK